MLYIILLTSLVLFAFMGIVGAMQTEQLFLVVMSSDIAFADIGFTLPSFNLNNAVTIAVMVDFHPTSFFIE